MRRWETTLRHDAEAWTDFKLWLEQLESTELRRFTTLGAADFERHKGKLEGIRYVLTVATVEEREEASRVRRDQERSTR